MPTREEIKAAGNAVIAKAQATITTAAHALKQIGTIAHEELTDQERRIKHMLPEKLQGAKDALSKAETALKHLETANSETGSSETKSMLINAQAETQSKQKAASEMIGEAERLIKLMQDHINQLAKSVEATMVKRASQNADQNSEAREGSHTLSSVAASSAAASTSNESQEADQSPRGFMATIKRIGQALSRRKPETERAQETETKFPSLADLTDDNSHPIRPTGSLNTPPPEESKKPHQ